MVEKCTEKDTKEIWIGARLNRNVIILVCVDFFLRSFRSHRRRRRTFHTNGDIIFFFWSLCVCVRVT